MPCLEQNVGDCVTYVCMCVTCIICDLCICVSVCKILPNTQLHTSQPSWFEVGHSVFGSLGREFNSRRGQISPTTYLFPKRRWLSRLLFSCFLFAGTERPEDVTVPSIKTLFKKSIPSNLEKNPFKFEVGLVGSTPDYQSLSSWFEPTLSYTNVDTYPTWLH